MHQTMHPTMHHPATEMCTHVHISVTKWSIMVGGYVEPLPYEICATGLLYKWLISLGDISPCESKGIPRWICYYEFAPKGPYTSQLNQKVESPLILCAIFGGHINVLLATVVIWNYNFSHSYLEHFLWNCHKVNATRAHWWEVRIS